MKRIGRRALVLCAVGLAQGLAACGGPQDKAAPIAHEQSADGADGRSGMTADHNRSQDDQTQASLVDAMTKQAENRADALGRQAPAGDTATGH